jgi:hypothetical protein
MDGKEMIKEGGFKEEGKEGGGELSSINLLKNYKYAPKPNQMYMYKEITREKALVIIVMIALLMFLSFLSGVAYGLLLKPNYGERYANIFFMVSFTLIFFSLVYVYHLWITRIQGREE